ncbi:PilZ domain-containing protein [Sphingomonas gellani]|uniref:PilZ domain-containing protein n=1 Tax=Sphingomonas gellani TaxID=1166340 RepID=A0A1H8EV84_9SPHN|nr:PilZ domain-containing protein [Sphingomonas gellani]SEN23300.1 PilZ domain-containing protein [Sphingomonas gellani]
MADLQPNGRALRAARRRKLFQPAELRHGDMTQRVHLLDLSTSGGLVHITAPPPAGAIVTISCGPLSRSARVAWSAERRIGVAFVRALSDRELEAVIGRPPTSAGETVMRSLAV